MPQKYIPSPPRFELWLKAREIHRPRREDADSNNSGGGKKTGTLRCPSFRISFLCGRHHRVTFERPPFLPLFLAGAGKRYLAADWWLTF